jgi:exopolysaccharide/PEP-CTERM locus tyrosine autokinase
MSLIERAIGRMSRDGDDRGGRRGGSATAEEPPGARAPESARESGRPREAVAGAAVAIRLDSLRRRGFAVPDSQASRTGEEFRVIKRPLIANAFGRGAVAVRNGHRVMVTSAFPGEGKSFCAINLALSIAAERDHQVLLVDADVARPSIPRELGFSASAGLMNLLLEPGSRDIADVVLRTNIDKLMILPAGRRHELATELLASQTMSRILDDLSARYPDRVIIFDSPPLLMTTESRVLATHMGQILMVVAAGSTPKAAVNDALATIDGAAEVIGLVLNRARGGQTAGYGLYGYGYGQGKS